MVLKGCLSTGIWNKDNHIQTRWIIHWRSSNWPMLPMCMYLGTCLTNYANVLGTSNSFPTSMYTIENWGQSSKCPELWSTRNQSIYMYKSMNAILGKYYMSQEQSLKCNEDLDPFHHKKSGWLAVSTDIKAIKTPIGVCLSVAVISSMSKSYWGREGFILSYRI